MFLVAPVVQASGAEAVRATEGSQTGPCVQAYHAFRLARLLVQVSQAEIYDLVVTDVGRGDEEFLEGDRSF